MNSKILIVCLCLCIARTQCIDVSQYVCLKTNSFLPVLWHRGVDMYLKIENEAAEKGNCADLWASGTCCEYKTLVRYAAEDQKNISNFTSLVLSDMQYIGKEVTQMLQASDQLATSGLPQPVFLTAMKEYLANTTGQPLQQDIHFMASQQGKFRSMVETCWKDMARYRANALCDTCAADSTKFFYGDKAIVDHQLCSKILRSCSSQYEFIVLFVTRSLSLVTKLYQALLDSGLDHEDILMLAIDTASEKLKAIQKLELSEVFSQLLDTDTEIRNKAKAKMCGLVTNLVHTTFIEQVSEHLAVISRIFGYLRLQLKKAVQAQQTTTQSSLLRAKSAQVLAVLQAQSDSEAARTQVLKERWARAEQEMKKIKEREGIGAELYRELERLIALNH